MVNCINGIDISNWQNGINLHAVPHDYAIIKATQNTGYVSPDCVRQVEQAISLGELWGVYHYIGGGGAVAEANHFIDSILNWIGKGILFLDWEEEQNAAWGNESYLEEVITQVKKRTGIPPVIYIMQSRLAAVLPVAQRQDCAVWVAQYANNTPTGYQDKPWNEGAYDCVIRQYTSHGQLDGWGGYLDLNKSYITAEQWQKYANPDNPPAVTTPTPTDTSATPTRDLAIKVMEGAYGDGDARKQALGERYEEVQAFINHIATASAATLADEVWDGKYGNGSERRLLLGSRYDEVMAVINAGSAKTHTVQSGETLSSIAKANGIDDYMTLAKLNNISNPDLIYAGQIIKLS